MGISNQTLMIIAALLCTATFARGQTIIVQNAVWSDGFKSAPATNELAKQCNGKDICEFAVNDLGLKHPNPDPVIKMLGAQYSCGPGTSYLIDSKEYLRARLNCNTPSEPQPNALAYYHLRDFEAGKPDSTDLQLPTGFRRCWVYVFDLDKNGNLLASWKNIPADHAGGEGIRINWDVKSFIPIVGTRPWISRLFIVAGSRIMDPKAACPRAP